MEKLTQHQVKNLLSLIKKNDKEISKLQKTNFRHRKPINDRIHYIFSKINEVFNVKYPCDDVFLYGFDMNVDDYETEVSGSYFGRDQVIILNDGGEFSFESGFPTKWLFEDFEEELINGKKNYMKKN